MWMMVAHHLFITTLVICMLAAQHLVITTLVTQTIVSWIPGHLNSCVPLPEWAPHWCTAFLSGYCNDVSHLIKWVLYCCTILIDPALCWWVPLSEWTNIHLIDSGYDVDVPQFSGYQTDKLHAAWVPCHCPELMHGSLSPLMWSLQYSPLSWAGTVLLWSSMWTLSGCSSQHEYALYCSHPLFVGHPTYVPHWFMDIEPMLQSAWGHYNCTSLFEWAFHWCSPPSVYIVLLLLPYWGSTPLMCLTIWAWQFWFLHYLVALCWSPPLLNGPILLHPTTQMGIMLAIWLL